MKFIRRGDMSVLQWRTLNNDPAYTLAHIPRDDDPFAWTSLRSPKSNWELRVGRVAAAQPPLLVDFSFSVVAIGPLHALHLVLRKPRTRGNPIGLAANRPRFALVSTADGSYSVGYRLRTSSVLELVAFAGVHLGGNTDKLFRDLARGDNTWAE